jgi:hypothetical protein
MKFSFIRLKNNIFSFRELFISFCIYISGLLSCINEESSGANKDISLSKVMFFNQVYMDKMFFAGQSENWELADFYHHEMEENMEKWLNGNLIKDTINTSMLGRKLLQPTFKELKKTIDEKNLQNFISSYHLVINSCNSCHTLTHFDFINIIVPKEPTFKNQEY